MADIAVIGSFNMDLVVTADSLPRPGETVLGSRFVKGPGGKGSNQALAAARLGADVVFIGAVGDDAFGHEARALYAAEGVDSTGLDTVDAPTGVALIVVDANGENQIAVASGANALVSDAHIRTLADRLPSVIVGQLETPPSAFHTAAALARPNGSTAILNPAPARDLDHTVLADVDILIPNEIEATMLTGAADLDGAIDRLHGMGVAEVIVTLGSDGAAWSSGDGVRRFDAHRIEAVDTTGAGDAFVAGVAVGLAETGRIEDGIALGLRAGAYAATRLGVLDSLPTRTALDAALPAA